MEVLLIEQDPLIRDQVKVGLQQFPEFTVTVGDGYQGVSELRSKTFDCVFLGVDPRDKESMLLLQHMRSFDQTTELVALADSRSVKDLSAVKGKYNIHSLLQTPLDVHEFFSFVGRFLERRTDRGNNQVRKGGKPASTSIRR